MQDSDIAITTLGMISALGPNMIQSCASFRAGIFGLQEWEGFVFQPEVPASGEPEPLICGRVAGLDGDSGRIPDLLASVLEELIQDAALSEVSPEDTALFVSLPPADRPGIAADMAQTLSQELRARTGLQLFEDAKIYGSGHAGVFLAVQDAANMLRQGLTKRCIVAGADSYFSFDSLEALDMAGRLISIRSQDAFIPGEGAGAFLMETCGQAQAEGREIYAVVDGIVLAEETNVFGSAEPVDGEGLGEAITKIHEAMKGSEVLDWIVCDLNGESYRLREWGRTIARHSEILETVEHLWHPADRLGDVGAATGAVMTVLASRAFQRGYAPSERALLWTSSENGDRGALLLRRGAGNTGIQPHRSSVRSDILEEHLEEAAFLYEEMIELRNNPGLSWADLDGFEKRFEAHLDGLALGGDTALDLCRQGAAEGDHSELHVATRLFCRRGLKDLVFTTIDQQDLSDGEVFQALADALIAELPPGWQGDIVKLLEGGDGCLHSLAIGVIGHRRIPAGDSLLGLIDRLEGGTLREAVWSLGRLRIPQARVPLFETYLGWPDEDVRAEAALTLLRIGEQQALQRCMAEAETEIWPSLPLGLAGAPEAFPTLFEMASSERADPHCLLALGLFGDSRAVDLLLYRFDSDELVEAISLALFLLTGAELYDEVFVPEEIDEEGLFDEERERLAKGEPLYPPGDEPGFTYSRISQNRDDWTAWWEENKSRFRAGIRYRCGEPCTPESLLGNLENGHSPSILRAYAYDELVIRHGQDFPFEPHSSVSQQKQTIEKYRTWIDSDPDRFQPGRWFFAGRVQ